MTKKRESEMESANGGQMQRRVICPYCEQPAKLVDSQVIYGTSYGMAWLCRPCKAWVGCHKNSKTHAPMGRLADEELRDLKKEAHAVFDFIWQRKMRRDKCSKGHARKTAYGWLANQLQIVVKDCHIGMFDIEKCKKVIEACKGI